MSREVYKKLITKRAFLRDANMEWLRSYERFIEDVGNPPSLKHNLKKKEGFIHWTRDSVYWQEPRKPIIFGPPIPPPATLFNTPFVGPKAPRKDPWLDDEPYVEPYVEPQPLEILTPLMIMFKWLDEPMRKKAEAMIRQFVPKKYLIHRRRSDIPANYEHVKLGAGAILDPASVRQGILTGHISRDVYENGPLPVIKEEDQIDDSVIIRLN